MSNVSNEKAGRVLLVAGVLLLSATVAGWTLSSRTLDNHECFVSVTSREMLASGNWVMPTFNGRPRLQKTPLSYWLVAMIAKITGGVDEFTARLPSAAFAVLSVCAIIYFVAQWLSFRTALVCAGVWLTSFGYARYSHNARPEMVLTFFVVLCFLSFYSAITAQSRKKQVAYMVVFWVSFGLGNLAKGPAPIPLVIIPLFFYVAIFKQWHQVPKMLPVAGAIILLAILLPWPIVAAYKVNWNLTVWKYEFIDRFVGEAELLKKPFYYYLPQAFMFALPWAAFLPMAIAAPFYRVWGKKQPVMKFLWIIFISDLVFLMLLESKRQHYLMPIMPIATILMGIVLDDMVFETRAFTGINAKETLRLHIAAAFLLAAGLVAYGFWRWRQFLPAVLITAAVIVTGAIVIGALFAKKRPASALGCLFAWLVIVTMIILVEFVNPLDYNEPSRRFTLSVAQKVPATDKLVAYKTVSRRFIHYFGRVVPTISTESEVDGYYQQGCWIAAFGSGLDELLKDGRFELVYVEKGVEWNKQTLVAGGLFHRQSLPAVDAAGTPP
jgi:4-amino-4-deoxy-L-arabinose transferase-like glycosyltransferase